MEFYIPDSFGFSLRLTRMTQIESNRFPLTKLYKKYKIYYRELQEETLQIYEILYELNN